MFFKGLIKEGEGAITKVIITDGRWRKTLSAIRALGKCGIDVTALGNSPFDMGIWSKYTNKKLLVPNIKSNAEKFEKRILGYLENCLKSQNDLPVLLPMEEDTLEWIENNQDKLMGCRYLIPPKKSFYISIDKYKTMVFAKKLGIAIPDTKEFPTAKELITYLYNNKGKYVIKPKRSKGSLGVIYIRDIIPDEVIYKNWDKYGELIIQDMLPIEGEIICVGMIYSKAGRLISHFMHKRIYSYPISGGPSTYRISVNSKELLEESRKLLDALKWQGVAMVEWKRDIRDNDYKLLEINPRFWGGLELAIKCGINFPKLYVDLSYDIEPCFEIKQYKLNVISRWLIPGDILRFLSMKKNINIIREFFTNILKDSDEWDKDDIQGFMAALICQAFQVINPANWKYLQRK